MFPDGELIMQKVNSIQIAANNRFSFISSGWIIDIMEISIAALDAYRSFIHAFMLSLYCHWSIVYVYVSCLIV